MHVILHYLLPGSLLFIPRASFSLNEVELNALILEKDTKSGEYKLEKYKSNSKVHGYQLTISKSTQVILSRILENETQKITLSMYKK